MLKVTHTYIYSFNTVYYVSADYQDQLFYSKRK